MPDWIEAGLVSLTERQKLIAAVPCFMMLTAKESQTLALLMEEVVYHQGETVVTENALVDSVFIIVNGRAEVSRTVKKKVKKFSKKKSYHSVPIATLNSGDTIGLNDTGFFSTTGKRMATVKAITKMLLLRLDIKKLHHFLHTHQHIQHAMYLNTQTLLRIALIKQSLPFSQLSHERLLWLAEHIEEEKIPEGQIIFNQGDKGDRCYLIVSGKVNISIVDEHNIKNMDTILKKPTLFGEATFITNSVRNATAMALEDCELFVLKYQYLFELLESETDVAKMFMTLMVDRSRPLRNPKIIAHERITADQQKTFILKNPENGSYFKLSKEGWYIWKQMNGKHSMQSITLALSEEYNIFAPDVVAALILKLAKGNFITNVKIGEKSKISTYPLGVRLLFRMKAILEARIAFGDADKWLSSIYQKWAYLFFKPLIKLCLSICILVGFGMFIFSSEHMVNILKLSNHFWILVVLLIPCTVLSVALHELGHAFATKSYGYEVHYMGVGWYWLGPIAFIDTSDMWLSTRGPRIFVNLAGIFTDLLVGGMVSIILFMLPFGEIKAFLWFFVLLTYIGAFRMLNPLQELDGYYILMDLFEKPRLRQSAIDWLLKKSLITVRHPKKVRQYIPEIGYWAASLLFLIIGLVLTLFVQGLVFKIVGFKPSHCLANLIIPFLMVFIFSVEVMEDIFNRKDE